MRLKESFPGITDDELRKLRQLNKLIAYAQLDITVYRKQRHRLVQTVWQRNSRQKHKTKLIPYAGKEAR